MGPLRYSLRRLRETFRQWAISSRIERQGRGLNVSHPVRWVTDDPRVIIFGEHVSIGPFCEIVALASDPKSSVRGELRIGSYSVIGAMCNIRAAGGAIRIGDHCLMGQNVSLLASNHLVQSDALYWQLRWDEKKTGVQIGNNCWIGAGATILPGCSVGDNSVIAAGSVVTKSIPANEIWGNIPARKIRDVAQA